MANLIITNSCNAKCDFCFAADSRSRSLRKNLLQMDEKEVRLWLDFAMKAGVRELRLLGGEPTLHPQFADFVKIGRDAGCSITVFSNGAMPDPARNALAALDPDVCSVIVNMNAALRPEDHPRLEETLKVLGTRVTPGVTLTSSRVSLYPPAAAIEKYGLRKAIRVGISNPTWRGSNLALHPKRYPAVGQGLFEASFLTARHGIALEADCGFVRCMFGDSFEQLKKNGFQYISRCAPVLDFCTGGTVLPCFGLSNLTRVRRDDFPDAKAVFDHMTETLRPWHSFGIYPECTACRFFETEECCGGCLSARLRRLQPMDAAEITGRGDEK